MNMNIFVPYDCSKILLPVFSVFNLNKGRFFLMNFSHYNNGFVTFCTHCKHNVTKKYVYHSTNIH